MAQINISTVWSLSCNAYFFSCLLYNINIINTVTIKLGIQTSMTVFKITDFPGICNIFTGLVGFGFTLSSGNFYSFTFYNNFLVFGYIYFNIFYFCSFVAYCNSCARCCLTFRKILRSDNTNRIYCCNSFVS